MSKNSAIIVFGVLVAVMPFFGFPLAVKEVFYIAAGLLVAIIGYFSKVQYCASCKRIIESGRHVTAGESSREGDPRNVARKDISGVSPPGLE